MLFPMKVLYMGVYEDVLMKRGSLSDGPQFVDQHHADVTKLSKTN